jgi:hypothetical protein
LSRVRAHERLALELTDPVVVEFPLRGEWLAVRSPGDRIASHGTDILGQRFAYDFIRVDRRKGRRLHPSGLLRSTLFGFAAREAYGWGQPIHMPFAGEIVAAEDGWPEPARVRPLFEVFRLARQTRAFARTRDVRPLLGNYVIARWGAIFAVFAHLAPGSVGVATDQWLPASHPVGRVGHTGNSTAPHLHFQLMDSPDPLVARGIPCAFRELEVEREEGWETVRGFVPTLAHRVRFESATTQSGNG